MNTCAHCGKGYGVFQLVTYLNAPEGGVPVHIQCVQKFFESLLVPPLVKDLKDCVCEYCKKTGGDMRFVGLKAQHVWLHQECTTPYLRLIDD